MNNAMIILAYVLFCFIVSALARKTLKATWAYFLVSTLLPPVALIGVSVLLSSRLDWISIAFVVSALIALTCSIVYYFVLWLVNRNKHKDADSELRNRTQGNT